MESSYDVYQNNPLKYNNLRKENLKKAQDIADDLNEDIVVGLDAYDFSFVITPASCPSSHELFEVDSVSPSAQKTNTHNLFL